MGTAPGDAFPRRTRWIEALAWVLVLSAAAAVLAALGYRTRDADSRLYAEMAARMSMERPERWIAPLWPAGWYMGGLYREHPAGLFLLPAALAHLGYPPAQAAYLVNAVYQVLTLVLLQRLVGSLVDGIEARSVGWLIQLIPIAFTFRIRANHEQAVVLCLLLSVYGCERARRSASWILVTVVGLVGLLLVKGVFVVFGPLACALWLLCRVRSAREGMGKAWLGLGVASAAMLLVAWVYGWLYGAATGQPFWSFYLSRQLGVAAVGQPGALLVRKAYNLVWYLGRVLWFPFPWSLTLLAAVVAWRRRCESPNGPAMAGALFALGLSALYVGAFTLSDRRADRYIFPVYYAIGAAGVVAALRAFPGFRALAERIDRAQPWVTVAVWSLTFAMHLFAGRLGLPTIKVWTAES